MSGPPPPPRVAVEEGIREQLLAELRALDTSDLLALCLDMAGSPDRLRLYLSLMRARSGTRAQLASCLVCFDLARAGDPLAQREFSALAPTIIELARDGAVLTSLLGGDPYLAATWSACQAALAGADPREDSAALHAEVEVVGELDLLSGEELDLGDILEVGLQPEGRPIEEARARYADLLSRHLGQDPETGQASGQGFATSSGRDLDRLEAFLLGVRTHAAVLPAAAGLASLGQLYLATHLRSRTLFGRPNPRRRVALREGLRTLPADALSAAMGAAAFELEGTQARLGFEKVLELLLDYLQFCGQRQLDPRSEDAADAYVTADRQPPPVFLTPGGSRRRRG